MQDGSDEPTVLFASDASFADEQRRVLRDLLRIAAECADMRQQAQADAEASRSTARAVTSRLERRLQNRHQRFKEELRTYWRSQLEQVKAKARPDLDALEAEYRAASNEMLDEVESTAEKTEQKLEQNLWLADSMYEAALEQVQHEYKLTKDQIESDLKELLELAEQGHEQLQLFSLQPTPLEEADLDERKADEAVKAEAVNTSTKVNAAHEADADTEATTATTEADAEVDAKADNSAPDDPLRQYDEHREATQRGLDRLRRLLLPFLFKSVVPFTIVIIVCVSAVVVTWWFTEGRDWPATRHLLVNAGALGLSAALILGLGAVARRLAIKQMLLAYQPVHENLDRAHRDLERRLVEARRVRRRKRREADQQRRRERQEVQQKYKPALDDLQRRREAVKMELDERFRGRRQKIESSYSGEAGRLREQGQAALDALNARYRKYVELARQRYAEQVGEIEDPASHEQAEMKALWQEAMERLESVVAYSERLEADRFSSFDETRWEKWQPTDVLTRLVRFGALDVDLQELVAPAVGEGGFDLQTREAFSLPALLALPRRGSLLVECDPAGSEAAVALLQAVMARLLTIMPPGQVRFTMIDPVGRGQSFDGFMRLAEYDAELVDSRIWKNLEQIDTRLDALIDYMDHVSETCLGETFATLEDYNAQASEMQPYRYVVVADYPHQFSERAIQKLDRIVSDGARCGVYALVLRDLHKALPRGFSAKTLEQKCVQLVYRDGYLQWEDDVFGEFPLTPEKPPHEIDLAEIISRVGEQVRRAKGAVES